MNRSNENFTTDLPLELSALEAALADLAPAAAAEPGVLEEAKSTVLLRLIRYKEEFVTPLSGEKLIETIVKSGDREITLSLREYVRAAKMTAGMYGAIFGAFAGVLLGIIIGISGMIMLQNSIRTPETIREIHNVHKEPGV